MFQFHNKFHNKIQGDLIVVHYSYLIWLFLDKTVLLTVWISITNARAEDGAEMA